MTKTVIAIWLIMLASSSIFAQSDRNYRSRNHKLNKMYLNEINTKKHQFATYKKRDMQIVDARHAHGFSTQNQSQQLVAKNTRYVKSGDEKDSYRNQPSTVTSGKRKSGKRLLNFFSMMLAVGLIMTFK